MNPYRVKHIPTGLYYKPGETNLSKNGKIYQTGANILNYTGYDKDGRWCHWCVKSDIPCNFPFDLCPDYQPKEKKDNGTD